MRLDAILHAQLVQQGKAEVVILQEKREDKREKLTQNEGHSAEVENMMPLYLEKKFILVYPIQVAQR